MASQPPTVQGDYIPCKFTVTELRTLVSPEVASVLTDADAESLKQQVIDAALTQNDDPLVKGVTLNLFTTEVTNDPLSGLTPSQALNRVISALSNAQKSAVSPTSAEQVNSLGAEILKAASDADKPDFNSFIAYLKTPPAGIVGIIPFNGLRDAAASVVKSWSEQLPKPAQKSVQDLNIALIAAQPIDNGAIIDAARTALASFERPPDVGCAMSILTYREADTAYGYRIANEYIAVQVIVRNLNRDQAFVLHDAEFEVNTDPTQNPGRFFSGRDKVIVRALSAQQDSFDPRALVVHTAEGVGALLSAVVPIFTVANLTNATAVFNGAFVPGLDKYWKDETGDQLNLLNDTGFSAQQNSQTSVAPLGTVLFVIFIPSKQFQEGWWTQECVERTYVGSTDKDGNFIIPGRTPAIDGLPQGVSKDTGVLASLNIQRALETCSKDADYLPRSQRHWWTLGRRDKDEDVKPVPEKAVSSDKSADFFRNAYPRPYKKWPPNSLQLFADLSNTVVAGTHITEDSQLQPSVSALKCDTNSVGDIQFPSPDKGTVSCTVTGKNLDKIAQLRLRNATDATDTATAEGPVSVSGDSTSGTVEFKTADLHALPQPAYTVYSVSSKGVEQKTGQTIHLSTDPFVSELSPKSIDLSKEPKTPQTLTITGYHLGSVDTVVLTDHANSKNAASIPLTLDALKKDTQLLVTLDPTSLTISAAKPVTLDVTFLINKKQAVPDPAVSLPFTGPTASASGKTTAGKPTTATPTTSKAAPGGITKTPSTK